MTKSGNVARIDSAQENADIVKWCRARHEFFVRNDMRALREGLAVARECQHADAVFLCSLFRCPSSGNLVVPESPSDALSVFLDHGGDARCLCWAAFFSPSTAMSLLRASAESGYRWAQALFGWCYCEGVSWLELSAAQGDRSGLNYLGQRLWHGRGCTADKVRARELLRRAEQLGDAEALFFVASECCGEGSLEQIARWRVCAIEDVTDNSEARVALTRRVGECVRKYESGRIGGRIVFEFGEAFHGRIEAKKQRLSGVAASRAAVEAAQKAVQLRDEWCGKAKRAVLCWLWIAKRERKASRDVRRVIAGLIWQQRAAWSELN